MINSDDNRTFSDFSISIFNTLQYPFQDISINLGFQHLHITIILDVQFGVVRRLFYQNYLNWMEDHTAQNLKAQFISNIISFNPDTY